MRRTPTACTDFRELLERALCEPAAELQPLSWHEHLNACPECRRVLEEEEALEYLLASLPAPQLPEALIERVLARLRGEHETGGLDTLLDLDHLDEPAGLPDRVLSELELDRLLARVPEIEPPAGLGAGVLAELGIDRLLAQVPEIELPAGLSARVLAALESERHEKIAPIYTLRRLAPLAATLLALLGFLALRGGDETDPAPEDGLAGGPAQEQPSDEMLALMDILSEETIWAEGAWEGDEAIDLALSLDESDELLLEYLFELSDEDGTEKNG